MTDASPGNACVELLVIALAIQRVLEIRSVHRPPDSIDVDLLLVDPHVVGTFSRIFRRSRGSPEIWRQPRRARPTEE